MFKGLSSKISQRKGFTLVELMIVIAVIAILMLVLVPRIGVLRHKAKVAGVKANVLMLEGIIRSEMEEATTVGDLETAIDAALDDANIVTADKMRNPVTGANGCIDDTAFALPTAGAVVYKAGDADPTVVEADTFFADPLAGAEGMVGFAVYPSGTKLMVKLYGYDENGVQISTLTKTISQ